MEEKMKHVCVKCKCETEESNDKFCHLCIAQKAFQMYRRAGNIDALHNWFWAIEELIYESKIYQWI